MGKLIMNKERIEDWLEAILILKRHYHKFKLHEYPEMLKPCPLCKVVNLDNPFFSCVKCLWMLYPPDRPDKNKNNKYKTLNSCHIVQFYTTRWTLVRLEKWKEILLKKREKL